MLICDWCGRLIEEDELKYYTEPHGERRPDDCSCGGTFVEARRCECCGEYYDESEMIGFECVSCQRENEEKEEDDG